MAHFLFGKSGGKLIKAICLASLVVIIIGLLWSNYRAEYNNKLTAQQKETIEKVDYNIQKPFLKGIDKDGQPYQIWSEVAEVGANKVINLKAVRAIIDLKTGKTVEIKADKGFLKQKSEVLELIQNVEIITSKQEHIYTEQAEILLDKHNIQSKHKVRITSPQGNLTAGGFYLDNKTDKIDFYPPVRYIKQNNE